MGPFLFSLWSVCTPHTLRARHLTEDLSDSYWDGISWGLTAMSVKVVAEAVVEKEISGPGSSSLKHVPLSHLGPPSPSARISVRATRMRHPLMFHRILIVVHMSRNSRLLSQVLKSRSTFLASIPDY